MSTSAIGSFERTAEGVLSAVHELDIPKEELIVVGGAAMQIYGIKITRDIDVVVTPQRLEIVINEWENLSWPVDKERTGTIGRRGLNLVMKRFSSGQLLEEGSEYEQARYGAVSFMLAPNDHLYQASFDDLKNEAEEFDSVLVSPPDRILAWKQAINREKDARDILLLQQHLGV